MAKLTAAEKHLIQYPPTPETWLCQKKRGVGGTEQSPCPGVNPGSADRCIYCGTTKPRRPKLLWPAYVAACAKAGLTPKGAA